MGYSRLFLRLAKNSQIPLITAATVTSCVDIQTIGEVATNPEMHDSLGTLAREFRSYSEHKEKVASSKEDIDNARKTIVLLTDYAANLQKELNTFRKNQESAQTFLDSLNSTKVGGVDISEGFNNDFSSTSSNSPKVDEIRAGTFVSHGGKR